MARLLLISNSTSHGGGYLDHCAGEISAFLGPSVQRVLFVPFAVADREGYAARTRARFEALGYGLDSLDDAEGVEGVRAAVAEAEAVFVGGGNTFRLLHEVHARGALAPIRSRIHAGAPYVGSSAGTNLACPTIRTTNDMPIVEPPSFEALGLVPFQVNAHYQDPDPGSRHMGETREQRIAEFHEENTAPVVGLREGAMLRIEAKAVELRGRAGARLFRRGEAPEEFAPGSRLDFLAEGTARSSPA